MNLELYQNKTSIFQSEMWMNFSKSLYGMQSYQFEQFVLQETIEMIYISGITKNQLTDLTSLIRLVDFIKDINMTDKRVLIDFQILNGDEIANRITNTLRDSGLVSTAIHIIPRQRFILDLSNTMESIEKNYKNKTLNDIKRAEKNGVIVVENWDIQQFYEMYLETSERHNFRPMAPSYFDALCNVLKETGKGKLLFSTKEDYPYFSGAIIAEYNNILYYLYTGSNHLLNHFNGSSVLQHYIIKWAKSKGYYFYDLMGVRDDPNFGPTKFKLKFSNNIIKLMNSFTLDGHQ